MTIALFLACGLAALYYGAEWLVRGAASLAVRLGVTPLLVGLTVVAFGTSTPELVVSSMAALDGQGGLAIGNVVGSNIFNIGIILGLTAVVCPMRVQLQLLKFDTPIMLAVAGLFLWCFRDGAVQLAEAALFLFLIVAYTLINIRLARRQAGAEVEKEFAEGMPAATGSVGRDIGLILAGLIVLLIGSRLFVVGAVELARALGWSEAVIGLTIVAAGTSLPELASSLMAALRRQPDIAVGNVVGSNIYNILAILGVCGVLAPPVDGVGISQVDSWVMIGLSAAVLALAWTGFQLRRWEGALLIAIYGGYLWHLWPK